ncbi:ABC transporter permease [Saxibacter everestensis]|uniref:ABC transporter permease n=1 Tax=Saxibacter everestensis TaxID=2909229 RepID=A0ABY8QQE7_9MICO|nr:ABC transporter permease [Brevibacteriaceae bacterium ZFBP1038]
MFVAWRDIRFAKGRFLLIGTVVTLITLLVGFLSGLTAGLANQNISVIQQLDADRIVFSEPADGAEMSYGDSELTRDTADGWEDSPGIGTVNPIGISQTKASGQAQASVALFGVQPGYSGDAPAGTGKLVLSQAAAADLDAASGDSIRIADAEFTVEAVTGDAWYSHTPVIWMNLEDWQDYETRTGSPDAFATVLAVTAATGGSSTDFDALDKQAETTSTTVLGSLTAIGSFRSEIGSLLMMVVMLFGISALAIGAFFTVWTIQRRGDVAVLKALGASNSALIRDALGQALIVLLLGVGTGIGLTAALGALAGTALPFVLSPFTTLLPACAMIALGLAGAAFALRSVTTADPLTALGSNR